MMCEIRLIVLCSSHFVVLAVFGKGIKILFKKSAGISPI